MGRKWEGGDVARFPGGGQKILLLRDAIEKLKDRDDLVVMFVDRCYYRFVQICMSFYTNYL